MADLKEMAKLWAAAASRLEAVRDALDDLEALQSEYEAIYDDLSEEQQEGPFGERLCELTVIDFDTMRGVIDDAFEIELPTSRKH